MERRQLLKMAPAFGASVMLGQNSWGVVPQLLDEPTSPTATLFTNAKSLYPELIGFESVNRNFVKTELTLEGKIPKDLQGNYYRNGPAKYERNGIRYQHLFEGDGMLQHFQIAGGKVFHRGRFIETPKYTLEEKAKRFIYSGPETKIAGGQPITSNNLINTANTNVIMVGNHLWALWEAGSATKVDPQTLDYVEQIDLGKQTHYGTKLKGLPFSAHPKIEPKGDIWNFGLHPSGSVVLYHLNAQGKTKKVGMVDSGYKGGMLHDFLITERHILLILPSLKRRFYDKESSYFSGIEFAPQQAMRVQVIDKHDFSVKREYELESGFAFHFGNAWEDKQGDIHFDASLYPDVDVLYQMSNLMNGDVIRNAARAKTVFVTLKKAGGTRLNVVVDGTEFPKVYEHQVGRKNNKLFCISAQQESLWSNTVNAIDTETSEVNQYHYGESFLVEEHVPIRTQAGNQYLIGTALHIPSKRTCLNVFQANKLADGPVARAWLDYHLPIGFHGSFQQG